MKQPDNSDPHRIFHHLRRPLALTWAGLMAERLVRAFWPLWTLLVAVSAALLMGLHDLVSVELFWAAGVVALLALVGFAVLGARRFVWPRRAEALARMDAELPGRPIASLTDRQVTGLGDTGSEALWEAHQARMLARAQTARPVQPDLRISRFDVFGLRYIALLGLVVALCFGSLARVISVSDKLPGQGGQVLAEAVWEGWIEPPAHTGLPTLYLTDQGAELDVPQGSRVTVRFYGEVGALSLSETVSARTRDIEAATDIEHDFNVAQAGEIRIDGPGGRSWEIGLSPDAPPSVTPHPEAIDVDASGVMTLPFEASDDYAVVAGRVRISLDVDAIRRQYGLTPDPEPRPELVRELVLPVTGSRADISGAFIDDFSKDLWAHLPVTMIFEVEDASGQVGRSAPLSLQLPARRFFDPMASAVIEQRRDLLWSPQNATRVAQVMRAISYEPDDTLFRSNTRYLRFRTILRRLETMHANGVLTEETRQELAEALWALAIGLEEGDINDALERMRAAQERLNDAMREGASPEEIARLMQELRDATQDYLRQKAEQAARNGDQTDQPDTGEETMEMSQQDLQAMLDHIQDLINQGRMAEAQRALEEFQRLMENMQTAQGQGGGGGGPGQQALDGLAETLREQQGLSDEAFRDLQDQFSGRSDGSDPADGAQGEGTQDADGGRGQAGDQSGDQSGDLAGRQDNLRRQLEGQRDRLPGAGSEAGDAARQSLDEAGRAMDQAEDALRGGDLPGAIDRQAEAMDALRDGIRSLGEALAQGQRGGQQGQQSGRAEGPSGDPLGRTGNASGQSGAQDDMLQDEDVYRRARDLLDEIRRRSGETMRPDQERDYLRRLLDRF